MIGWWTNSSWSGGLCSPDEWLHLTDLFMSWWCLYGGWHWRQVGTKCMVARCMTIWWCGGCWGPEIAGMILDDPVSQVVSHMVPEDILNHTFPPTPSVLLLWLEWVWSDRRCGSGITKHPFPPRKMYQGQSGFCLSVWLTYCGHGGGNIQYVYICPEIQIWKSPWCGTHTGYDATCPHWCSVGDRGYSW